MLCSIFFQSDFIKYFSTIKKSETKLTASILKQDQNVQEVCWIPQQISPATKWYIVRIHSYYRSLLYYNLPVCCLKKVFAPNMRACFKLSSEKEPKKSHLAWAGAYANRFLMMGVGLSAV